MASTYTAVPANVSLTTPVAETLPSDGDPLGVASVNSALQKLADYTEALRQRNTGIARAWGAFSTSGAGALTLIASYNVASVVLSSGDALITFSSAMPSANFIVVGNAQNGSSGGTTGYTFPQLNSIVLAALQTTTQFHLAAVTYSTGNQMSFSTSSFGYVSFAVFG